MESKCCSKEQIITDDKVSVYLKDVEKHFKEISMRKTESFGDKAKTEKAQKDNAKSILEFRDKIERFLKYCDIRFLSEEESKLETKI